MILMAHGRDGVNVACKLVYHRLDIVRQKWRDIVGGFRGY